MAMSAAKRRYITWFIPTMVAYVVAIFVVVSYLRDHPPTAPLTYLLAIIPAIPVVGVIALIGRYVAEEADEFLRMRQVVALLIGVGITLTFCAIWGFLEMLADAPKVGLFYVVVIFFAAQGIGGAIASWWYR